MIASLETPVSSVVRLAEAACAAEGVELYEIRHHRHNRKQVGPTPCYWPRLRERVVWRMRQAPNQPSFPEIAQALGMASHGAMVDAFWREDRRRLMGEYERLVEVGRRVAEQLDGAAGEISVGSVHGA